MSRLLLLASFLSLPLLATACSDGPEPPLDLRFEGPGLDDDGIWYLPDHEATLTVWSADPGRAAWTFTAEGPMQVTQTPLHGSDGSTTTLRATEVGHGTVTLLDGDGAPLTEVETHVTYPDRILLTRDGVDGPYRMGNSARILRGDSVTLDVTYAQLDHILAGTGLIEGSEQVAVELTPRGDAITLTALPGRHDAWMSAGPDASYVVDVQAIEPGDTVFRLLTGEVNVVPGGTATIRPSLRHAGDGEPVLYGSERWTRDGEPIWALTSYTYDPTAPASTIEVRIGHDDAVLVATTVIHAAP